MLPRKKDLAKQAKIEADPERSPKHLAYIRRTYVCVAWKSGECEGPNQAHHPNKPALYLRGEDDATGDNHGTGRKVSDFEAVPLCEFHHSELHTIGPKEFEEKYGVDLISEGRKLVSPYKPRNWKPDA